MGLGGTPPINTRISLLDQTSHMGIIAQTMEDHLINAQISHLIETMETDLEMDPSTTRMGIGETKEILLVLHRPIGEISHKIADTTSLEVINSALHRSDNRPPTGFTPYEQKFPQNKNQTSSNVVRFTTIDDTINELSDLCPLKYKGRRTQSPTNLEIQDLASISSTSPPETPKKIVVQSLNLCWTPEHLVQSTITEPSGIYASYSTQLLYKKLPR